MVKLNSDQKGSIFGIDYDLSVVDDYSNYVTLLILRIMNVFRRKPDDEFLPVDLPLKDAFEFQFNELYSLICKKQPLMFAIAAFPCKASSPFKVASRLPDFGEFLAINMLYIFAEQISKVYEPGASIMICSDGHVFTDILRLSDTDVSTYIDTLRYYVVQNSLDSHIAFYDLRSDYYEIGDDINSKRIKMDEELSTPRHVLSKEKDRNIDALRSLRGMCRFLEEDVAGFAATNRLAKSELSKTAQKKLALDLAYKVIDRSRSWSVLIKRRFPECIRLSIHPQPIKKDKFGFQLLGEGSSSWTTPWHGVPLFESSKDCEGILSSNILTIVRNILTHHHCPGFKIVPAAYAALVGTPIMNPSTGSIAFCVRGKKDEDVGIELVQSVLKRPSSIGKIPFEISFEPIHYLTTSASTLMSDQTVTDDDIAHSEDDSKSRLSGILLSFMTPVPSISNRSMKVTISPNHFPVPYSDFEPLPHQLASQPNFIYEAQQIQISHEKIFNDESISTHIATPKHYPLNDSLSITPNSGSATFFLTS